MNEERAWKIYVIQKQERCYFTLQVKKQRFRVSKKIAYGDLVKYCRSRVQFLSVQWLSHVRLFVIPWITACQASLSITNSRSSPKLMSIESVMPSNHPILCVPFPSCPQSFPASGSFQMSQFFTSGGQIFGVSASTSVLPMNTQDWSP